MTPPNVVLFVADDLGWGDVGCYGATRISTPHLDAIAERGSRYVSCHAASSVCSPSRYAILTGRQPWRSPLQYGVLGGADPALIEPDVPTIASILKSAGYETAAIGKWHLGLNWTLKGGQVANINPRIPFHPRLESPCGEIDFGSPFFGGPTDLGFDRFFGISGSLDMPPYCFLDGRSVVTVPTLQKEPLVTSQRPGLMSPGWRDDEVDVRFAAEAVSFVNAARPGPFFLYVASAAPHRPCVPPDFVRGKSGVGPRGDGVMLVDWMVGRIVDALESTGVLDNTVMVFTSDNGAPLIFPEDGDVTLHRPNGPWRGQKADAYEGGYRVPLLVAGPGIPHEVSATTVSLLDLMSSVAAWSGGETVDSDGRPLGSEEPRLTAASAYDGRIMVSQAGLKAIYGTGSGGFSSPIGRPVTCDSPGVQLYDLTTDPFERVDIGSVRDGDARRLWGLFADEFQYGGQPGAIYDHQ